MAITVTEKAAGEVKRIIGEQAQNLCSQEIRITGVEQACHRCRPSSRIRLHLALLSSDHHF